VYTCGFNPGCLSSINVAELPIFVLLVEVSAPGCGQPRVSAVGVLRQRWQRAGARAGGGERGGEAIQFRSLGPRLVLGDADVAVRGTLAAEFAIQFPIYLLEALEVELGGVGEGRQGAAVREGQCGRGGRRVATDWASHSEAVGELGLMFLLQLLLQALHFTMARCDAHFIEELLQLSRNPTYTN